jgi:hypothetical protein
MPLIMAVVWFGADRLLYQCFKDGHVVLAVLCKVNDRREDELEALVLWFVDVLQRKVVNTAGRHEFHPARPWHVCQ